MHVIPAIDLIGGKCVRLSQGDYQRKTDYHDDPLEMAKRFEDAGLTRLHLVDLDGAKAKKIMNGDVLQRICLGTRLTVDFGGGIQAQEELEKAFSLGAHQVTGGSFRCTHVRFVWDVTQIQLVLYNLNWTLLECCYSYPVFTNLILVVSAITCF